eukprot:gene3835-4787_t
MGLLELVEQGQTYVDKLTKILREQNQTSPDIEVIFVLGKTVDEEASNPDRLKSSMTSISPGSRIVHYDTLIRGAQEAYSAYIEKSKIKPYILVLKGERSLYQAIEEDDWALVLNPVGSITSV